MNGWMDEGRVVKGIGNGICKQVLMVDNRKRAKVAKIFLSPEKSEGFISAAKIFVLLNLVQ